MAATTDAPLDGPAAAALAGGDPPEAPPRQRRRSLRSALAWLVLAVLLPLVVAGAVFIPYEWRQQRDAALARLQEHARMLQRAVDRELALDQAVLGALGTSRDIDAEDWRAFHAAAEETARVRPRSWFVLYDRSGRNLVNTSVPFGTPLPNYRDLLEHATDAEWQGRKLPLPRGWLLAPFDTMRPAFSGIFYGPVIRRPAVASTIPVVRAGNARYVLALAYGSEFFVSVLQSERAPDVIAGIWDAGGRFIARNRESERVVGLPGPHPFRAGVASLPAEGVGEAPNVDGIPFVYAYRRSAVADYVIGAGMPRSAVLAPAWRALAWWLAVSVSAGAVGSFFAFRLWRRVGAPLVALAQQGGAPGEPGDEVPPSGIEEVETLRSALQDAARNERTRRESEERFRTLADNISQLAWMADERGSIFWYNARWFDYTGTTLDEMKGWGWQKVHHPDHVVRVAEKIRRCFDTGEPWEDTFPLRSKDGEYRWFLSRAVPIRDASGTVVRWFGTNTDVTELRAIEEAARNSERRMRLIMEANPIGVVVGDAAGGIVEANDAYLRLIGRTRDDLVAGRVRWDAITPPEHLPLDERALAEVRARGVSRVYEKEYVRSDGQRVPVLVACAAYDIGGGLVAFVADVSDLKRADRALRQANDRLREEHRRKDEFLGMLSHELRNPLAPIRNSVYVLNHADPMSTQAARARTVIDRQSEHLTRLVDDLLDVTRIARGKVLLHRDRVDVRDLVARAVEDVQGAAEDRGVKLRVAVPEPRVWADADATRIAQVIGNLLNNAVKFTPAGGEVAVTLREVNATAEISVRDTGAGIDRELLPAIFEAFVQGKRTLARSEGGIGLGLALVKGLVELHGGSVEARSEGIGKGAEFVVRLPLVGPLVNEHTSDVQPRRATRPRRVLVVDDNADAAESLAELARLYGHHVEVAYDGPSALEKVRQRRPDVVLCDIGLPGMTGYEVAQALRAEHDGALRLVAVSGYARAEDVAKAIAAGFDAHVPKPPDPEKIERLLA